MPLTTIIKISGTIPADATTNDIASIDIPENGVIYCIGGAIIGKYEPSVGSVNFNKSVELAGELSFLSTNQIAANDARGSIAGLGVSATLVHAEATETGAGMAKMSEQDSIAFTEGIEVNAGERLHLHGISNLPLLTAVLTFMLYIKTTGGGRRTPKRR